jgi:hypothetical protein
LRAGQAAQPLLGMGGVSQTAFAGQASAAADEQLLFSANSFDNSGNLRTIPGR